MILTSLFFFLIAMQMKAYFLKFFLWGFLLLGGMSCTEDILSEFSHYPAFFRYPNVNTTPELRAALNSPGEFCKITFPPSYYQFTNAHGRSTQVNRTSLEAYGKPVFIAGFLVGTPSVPDASSNFYQVAYDLVCPNCFHESSIQRALDFEGINEMKCSRCGRIYELNNHGIVKNKQGKPLEHYHMTYAQPQGVLIIQN